MRLCKADRAQYNGAATELTSCLLVSADSPGLFRRYAKQLLCLVKRSIQVGIVQVNLLVTGVGISHQYGVSLSRGMTPKPMALDISSRACETARRDDRMQQAGMRTFRRELR